MKTVSKELFIMALLLMIIVFMVGIIFYDYMPNNRVVPEPISYQTDSSTTAVLQEIATSSTSSTDSDSDESAPSIIKSYRVGQKELNKATEKQSYVSGKTDPFAETTQTLAPTGNPMSNDKDSTTTTTTSSSTSGKNSNSNSSGTFFESSNSK